MIGDFLLEGGENSQFHVLKLNRAYGADGKVTVDPQLVFNAPGWDAELLAAVSDTDVSIENSVAVYGNTVYFSNSGGLVQGWDLTPLRTGGAPQRVFRYWTGDDTDASIVIDEEGMLYIGVEYERLNERSRAVGQIVKLDPSRADPLVWKRDERPYNNAGVWATPALYKRHRHLRDRRGQGARPRSRHRRNAVVVHAAPPDVAVTGRRRRRVHHGRLRRRAARLRHARHARATQRAVAGRARWLHRIDAGRVERAASSSAPAPAVSSASVDRRHGARGDRYHGDAPQVTRRQPGGAVMDHYIVISCDGHAGAATPDFKPYLPQRLHDDFDAWWQATTTEGELRLDSNEDPRNFDLAQRFRDLEADGVVAEVIYPNTLTPFARGSFNSAHVDKEQVDVDLRWEGLRAYNRWAADWVGAAPHRLAAMAQISLHHIAESADEIRWAHDAGLRGGVLLPGSAAREHAPALSRPRVRPDLARLRRTIDAAQPSWRQRGAALRRPPGIDDHLPRRGRLVLASRAHVLHPRRHPRTPPEPAVGDE